jgi:hypothetical protein
MGVVALSGWTLFATLFDLLYPICKVDANARGGRFMSFGLPDNAQVSPKSLGRFYAPYNPFPHQNQLNENCASKQYFISHYRCELCFSTLAITI